MCEIYLIITVCDRQHRQLPHASLIRESSKNQARLIDRHRVDFRANLWVNSNGCPQNEAIGFGAHPSFAVIRGSSASRNPSPTKFSAISVSASVAAGKIMIHQYTRIELICAAPSAISDPKLA